MAEARQELPAVSSPDAGAGLRMPSSADVGHTLSRPTSPTGPVAGADPPDGSAPHKNRLVTAPPVGRRDLQTHAEILLTVVNACPTDSASADTAETWLY